MGIRWIAALFLKIGKDWTASAVFHNELFLNLVLPR